MNGKVARPPVQYGERERPEHLSMGLLIDAQVAHAIGFPTSQAMHFRPGGTMDISRWWSASVTTGVGHNRFCVPAGAPDQDWLLLRAPVRRPCRDAKSVMSNSGAYARASAPANIHRPSGTKMHRLTCGETNGGGDLSIDQETS